MSPNPADLNSALDDLRDERPSEKARARLMKALHHPTRRSLPPRAIFAAALATTLAIVLIPRGNVSVAWAQAQVNTSEAPRSHMTWYDRNGHVTGETWNDGKKSSHYSTDRNGKVWIEMKNDAKRQFWFIGRPGAIVTPNARLFATIRNIGARPTRYAPPTQVERLLNEKNIKVVSQESVSTDEGPRVKYVLSMPYESHRYTVFAEPETGRIRRTLTGTGEECRFEYPESISSSVFDPTKPRVPGVELHDTDREKKIVASTMRRGLGKDKGITLRLVVLDGYGSVWVFWTGWLPDGRMSRPIRFTGVPTDPPGGPKMYTSSYKVTEKNKPPMIQGQRIGAMALAPKIKIGDRLSEIVIPAPTGKAVFRNVPVMRCSSLFDFGLF